MRSMDWGSAPAAAPATIPTPIFRLGKKLRHKVSAVVARSSRVGDRAVYDPALFSWIAAIEARWPEIRDELQAVLALREAIPPLASISPDHRRIAPPGKWKSFFLKGYGYVVEENIRRCPVTAELVANAIEHTAGDSPIELVVDLLPSGCQVEVHDPSPAPPGHLTRPVVEAPDPWQEHGRGLLLIRALSSSCGHRPTASGTAVWFRLPVVPAQRRAH